VAAFADIDVCALTRVGEALTEPSDPAIADALTALTALALGPCPPKDVAS
jgi:hypothetical protein